MFQQSSEDTCGELYVLLNQVFILVRRIYQTILALKASLRLNQIYNLESYYERVKLVISSPVYLYTGSSKAAGCRVNIVCQSFLFQVSSVSESFVC